MKRFFLLVTILWPVCRCVLAMPAQDDTVLVYETAVPPIVDANGQDACWQSCKWQPIDQVWIDYGTTVPANDFSGRFKVTWSSATNLLYILVEIVDDVFVDGYVYNRNPSLGGGYPDYDIVEVFIDQNKSGGLHVFDGTGATAQQWGSNAENAFSYHIAANLRADGQPTSTKVVCDLAGASWSQYHIPNYADHLPQFAMVKSGDKYYWEFSLQVYSDAYQPDRPADARVLLKAGDLMGFSMAYCDNDDAHESPKKRDHFFGSVWVPAAAFNDHWMNAGGFGAIRLMKQTSGVKSTRQIKETEWSVYPNPSRGVLHFQPNRPGDQITVYNVLGQRVLEAGSVRAQGANLLSVDHLPSGVYLVQLESGDQIMTRKISVVKE